MIEPRLWEIVNISPEESRRLRELPYDEFLLTPYWQAVRRLKLERVGHKCERCGVHESAKPITVHHKTYRHHGKEHRHLRDLLAWCVDCHNRWHLTNQKDVHLYAGKIRRKIRRVKPKRFKLKW